MALRALGRARVRMRMRPVEGTVMLRTLMRGGWGVVVEVE